MRTSDRRRLELALTFVAACLAAACNTTETRTFERADGARVDHAYVQPGTDFGRFDAVRLAPISVWYPTTGGQRLDDEALERLQAYYITAMTEALSAEPAYRVTDTPGRNVLELRTQFIDLKTPANAAGFGELADQFRFDLEPGKATIVVDLVDAETGDVLARAADVEKTDEYSDVTDPDTAEAEVGAALRRWAAIFRAFMDDTHGR